VASEQLLLNVAGAVADGEPVDWEEIEKQAAGRPEEARLRQLRSVARLAESTSSCRRPTPLERPRPSWLDLALQAVLALAALRFALGAGGVLFGVTDAARAAGGSIEAVALSFSLVGLWLLLGAKGDRRAAHLGGFFLTVAAAFWFSPSLRLRPLVDSGGAAAWTWQGLLAEPGFPVFLWLFVRDFPRVRRFSTLDATTRRGLQLATLASAIAFLGNLGAALVDPAHPAGDPRLGFLARTHPAGVYWLLLMLPTFPAIVVAWRRRLEAAPEERQRVALFTGGLMVGFAPAVVYVLLQFLVPAFDRLTQDPQFLAAMRWLTHLGLLTMPLVTAYAVRARGALDVGGLLGQVAQYLLVRSTLLAAIAIPLLGLSSHLYAHRGVSLEASLATPPAQLLLVLSAIAGLLLALRGPLTRALDRWFFRDRPDLTAALAHASRVLQGAGTQAQVANAVRETLLASLKLDGSALLRRVGDAYQPLAGTARLLPVESALVATARAAAGPLKVDPELPGSAFLLLPEQDRHWVLDAKAALLQPLRDASGSLEWLLVLGAPRSGAPLDRQEEQFAETLSASAALALENCAMRTGAASVPASREEPAGQCPGCARLHARPGVPCGCGSAAEAAPLPFELHGKFRLSRWLGRGGMGVVYEAEDVELGRRVALKTLPRLSAEHAARLRSEARSMAALSHPHLALIYGVESWRGTPVLVVEYLEGGTLAERLAHGPVSTAEALVVCSAIAEALEEMHRRGMLHRDVKPSNIGFTRVGVPKLLDFGLAQLLGSSLAPEAVAASEAWETPTGHVVGTPLYMSPEAFAGAQPTAAADVWALALVLFECLVGTAAMRARARTLPAPRWAEACVELSGRLAEDRPSRGAAALLERALATEARRRVSTASELRRGLAAVSGADMGA
jgi:hypothetical protein